MVRRALLPGSFLGLLLLVFISCSRPQASPALQSFNADSIHIHTHTDGLLYLGQRPFSGIVYRKSPAGDTIFRFEYLAGRENGVHKQWYPDGRLKELRCYTAGKKTGTHLSFWPDGKRRFIYHYQNDVYEGEELDWYPNGQLFKCMHYKEGHENGMEQEWDEDGNIMANYEARNGRNYGNIGVKHCTSKWEK